MAYRLTAIEQSETVVGRRARCSAFLEEGQRPRILNFVFVVCRRCIPLIFIHEGADDGKIWSDRMQNAGHGV